MTDIMHMLQQAQAQAAHNVQKPEQSDSVASFFSSLAINKQSTNVTPSMPIPVKSNTQQGFTLESIERNIPKISPPPPSHHDTQQRNAGSQQQQQNDLMANSPLAHFISSNNLNSMRGPPPQPQQEAPIVKNNNSTAPAPLPGFNSVTAASQPASNGIKETNKETKVLITPAMLTNGSSNGEKKPQQSQPEPLSKNQLLQAFKYLIDNDNDFTKKIHDAYLKSVNNS